jgi:hypothetical protein
MFLPSGKTLSETHLRIAEKPGEKCKDIHKSPFNSVKH